MISLQGLQRFKHSLTNNLTLKGTVHNKNLIYLIFPVAYGAIYPAKSFYIEQFGSRLSGDGKKTALAR